jgi:hypothetical protein
LITPSSLDETAVTLPIALIFAGFIAETLAYSGISQGVKQESFQMVKGLLNC